MQSLTLQTMNVGDVRFNLYQPMARAAGPTAATGRGGYATENIEAVSAIAPVRSATSGSTTPPQAPAGAERQQLLADTNEGTRGQLIDILV